MQGTPQTMQINPTYNHVLLDIYDFFESQIERFKKDKYTIKNNFRSWNWFWKKLET